MKYEGVEFTVEQQTDTCGTVARAEWLFKFDLSLKCPVCLNSGVYKRTYRVWSTYQPEGFAEKLAKHTLNTNGNAGPLYCEVCGTCGRMPVSELRRLSDYLAPLISPEKIMREHNLNRLPGEHVLEVA